VEFDYLSLSARNDEQRVGQTRALKLRLAQEHREDVAAYTAGKHALVARLLATVGVHR
jgi:GrpB-like predicted nucleotidyltransferase (UPF0157 family)